MGSAARLRRRLLGIPRRRGIRLRSIHLRTARKLVKRGLFLPPTSGFVCVTISCYDYIISSKGNNPHNIRRKNVRYLHHPNHPPTTQDHRRQDSRRGMRKLTAQQPPNEGHCRPDLRGSNRKVRRKPLPEMLRQGSSKDG